MTVEPSDAARPRHVLFLCVANSARSQMAEGIARTLAPPDIRISSAGSQPATVRPEAITVLNEVGIDITHHRSRGLDAIDLESVDTVVTLCAEEICPVFPRPVRRFHWSLDDPATAGGDEQARLDAFRRTRDELRRRLAELFSRLQERPGPGPGGTPDP